jgi:DNA ligase-1
MRCSLPKDSNIESLNWTVGVLSQEKADGMFANVSIFPTGQVVVTSRQGSVFDEDGLGTLVPDLAASLQWGTQTHGELLVFEDGKLLPRELSNGVMNHILSGGRIGDNQSIQFVAWDQIPLEQVVPKGKFAVPYAHRFAALRIQLIKAQRPERASKSVQLIPTRVVHSKKEAYAHFSELLKQDKEGTIIKNPLAIWMDGTSKDQIKLKLEFVVELEVIGFEEGNGKNADTFGSLIAASSCRQLVTGVPGFTDKRRAEIAAKGESYLGTIISVKANGILINDDGDSNSDAPAALFLPRFVEERLDKSEADSLDQIIAQRDAAIEAA